MDRKLSQTVIHVAVGVINNANGQILIALRDEKLHQGGLWEFPGGKIEAGETAEQALARELKEELGIEVKKVLPLIAICHDYPDRSVKLHVYNVNDYFGVAKGAENQPIRWVSTEELKNYAFPAANQPIIAAVRLPAYYAILDDSQSCLLLDKLWKILGNGVKLIQARLKNTSQAEASAFIKIAQELCKEHGADLLINSAVGSVDIAACAGIHLTSQDLLACQQRPFGVKWVAASCHNLEELKHAEKIGVDFVVLAPVLPTPTHPGAEILGWQHFAELIECINLPAYALGGVSKADLDLAHECGAQGIAGIRLFLE